MRLSNLFLPALLLALPIAAQAEDIFTFTAGPEHGSFVITSPSQITVDATGDLIVTFSGATGNFANETFTTFYSSADGGGYADDNSTAYQGTGGPVVFTGTHFNDGTYIFSQYAPVDNQIESLTITSTPEPSSLVLLGTGVLGLAGAVRRRLTK